MYRNLIVGAKRNPNVKEVIQIHLQMILNLNLSLDHLPRLRIKRLLNIIQVNNLKMIKFKRKNKIPIAMIQISTDQGMKNLKTEKESQSLIRRIVNQIKIIMM